MKPARTQKLLAVALVGAMTTLSSTLVAQTVAPGYSKAAEASSAEELSKPATPAEDPWQFTAAPLLWFVSINGDVTVRGRQADVDVGFDKLIEHANVSFMAYLELRKEKFGFYTQPNYMKLSADGNAGPLDGDIDMNIWIVDAGGFYQLAKWCPERLLTIDAVAGLRFWNLYEDLTLKGTGGRINFTHASTFTLWDPLIGLRSRKYLTEKLSLNLLGDIGGFGISPSTSDFSWQAVGTLGYDFTRRFSVKAGYRALSVDKHNGSGSSEKGANLILHGVIIALEFHW